MRRRDLEQALLDAQNRIQTLEEKVGFEVAHLQRVIVNLKSAGAISGILTDDRGPVLILEAAHYHEEGPAARPEPIPIEGRALIEVSNIAWTQVLDPQEG